LGVRQSTFAKPMTRQDFLRDPKFYAIYIKLPRANIKLMALPDEQNMARQ
jgi:hypothetical protein